MASMPGRSAGSGATRTVVEAAEFAVGIRSGLVDGRDAIALLGRGHRGPAPRPPSEWDEIEHKIGDFARVLGLSDRIEA